jgi:AraC-like DNA-binding protein
MDVVDELLSGVRGRGSVFGRSVLRPPWSLRFSDAPYLTLCLPLRGSGWIVPSTGAPRRIGIGDAAIVRGPEPFLFTDDPSAPAPELDVREASGVPGARELSGPRGARGAGDTRGVGEARGARDTREAHEARRAHEVREAHEARWAREAGGAWDVREARDTREVREARRAHEARGARGARDMRGVGEAHEAGGAWDVREAHEAREVREAHEARGARDTREIGEARWARDTREVGEAHEAGGAWDVRETREARGAPDTSEARGAGSALAPPADAGELTGRTVLLAGSYDVRAEVPRRLLRVLPPLLVLPDEEDCTPLRDYLEAQIAGARPGHQIVLDRLLDWLLVCTLRDWFDRPEAEPPQWYAALGDDVVGPALRALHEDPALPWTTASLAARAGVSRTTLAKRFTELVGEGPVSYLTGWRMTLAADLLARPELTVAAVARRVGYADAFGFSAAFKRVRGVSPTAYRQGLATAGPDDRAPREELTGPVG